MAVTVYQWTCAAGDLIPTTVYSVTSGGVAATLYDSTGTLAQGSTFTTDSLGRCSIWLPSGTYALAALGHLATDALATATITLPESAPPSSGAYVGAGLSQSIDNHGADSLGVNYSDAAFAAALAALPVGTDGFHYGTIYSGSGVYKFLNGLPDVGPHVVILGPGEPSCLWLFYLAAAAPSRQCSSGSE